jgi:hypothetical protein
MVEKAMEDDIVLFQNDALIVRSVSFAQTIFQKIKRFQANDSHDVRAIASYLLDKGKIDDVTTVSVLEYLKENLGDDLREVHAKEKLFIQRLTTALV